MKTYPNKQRYHEILRGMSPQEKLQKSFELTDLVKAAQKAGIRKRYPQLCDHEIDRLMMERQKSWHNQTY